MASPTDGQRDTKRHYRKQGFQTPYSKAGESVDPAPLPYSSYSTETHVATSPLKPGLTPEVQRRGVTPLVSVDAFRAYNYRTTPWHLYPKADSSNVIQRSVVNTGSVADGATQNIVEVYVTDSGTNPQAGSVATAAQPSQIYWAIKRFGHAELNGVTGITYQIVVDGNIMLSWNDFQLSPSSPYNQLWQFENPITVRSSLVFRVINNSGGAYNFATAGNAVDAVFTGWTEQYVYGSESEHTNVEPQ